MGPAAPRGAAGEVRGKLEEGAQVPAVRRAVVVETSSGSMSLLSFLPFTSLHFTL